MCSIRFGSSMAEQREQADLSPFDGLIKPETACSVLKALVNSGAMTTADLSSSLQLEKGRVHSGLRKLRWHGWVSSQEGESTKPGRRPHMWTLSNSPEEIVHIVMNDVQGKYHDMANALSVLERRLR